MLESVSVAVPALGTVIVSELSSVMAWEPTSVSEWVMK